VKKHQCFSENRIRDISIGVRYANLYATAAESTCCYNRRLLQLETSVIQSNKVGCFHLLQFFKYHYLSYLEIINHAKKFYSPRSALKHDYACCGCNNCNIMLRFIGLSFNETRQSNSLIIFILRV